ncbi:transcriptional regulator [Nocardioides sp. OK12]|uniref:LCP family protein n=1 Tax=Nocardioides sp. OK12 TaxID=2758661 RepID=UPI0021C3C58F|nr:LCP family protein [Nocardioides sp. OK12]GHJ57967.1 transcriptional regulator [Nocardioides sp. OK12]
MDDDQSPSTERPAPRPGRRRRISPERRSRRTVWRVVLITQLCLALLTAGTVAVAYDRLDSGLDVQDIEDQLMDRPEKREVEGPQEPLNILVLGTDDRSCEGCGIDGEAGGGGSDTTLLIHVSADRKEAYGVSLPRDALVTRPDCMAEDGSTIPGAELAMFNTAFAEGGAACTVQTLEQLTGVLIDHYVTVDFNGFVDMVDAVGGVEVCLPKEVADPKTKIYLDAGTQVLDGEDALKYVRERSVLSANSDIGRMKRQQAFIASMVNKVVSAGTLTRPDRVYSFLKAATGSLTLDAELDSLGSLADLALQFRQTGLSDIKFISVPFEAYEPDPNRLVWTDEADKLWTRIKRDKPLSSTLKEGSINAADPVGGTATPSASPSEAPDEPSTGATTEPQAPTEEEQAEALANGLCA